MVNDKISWLDTALIVSPIKYALCKSEEVFYKTLKKHRVPKSQWPPFINAGSDATTHLFSRGRDEFCIVCLGSTGGMTKTQVHALLVHEAVHIFRWVKERIGEDFPSSEFEAYSIQAISQRLMASL